MMNNLEDLDLNEELMNQKIESLKQLRAKLKNAFDKQKINAKELPNYWGGNSGEKANLTLEEHEKKYNDYLSELDNKIRFLEEIRDKYKQFDLENNSKIQ